MQLTSRYRTLTEGLAKLENDLFATVDDEAYRSSHRVFFRDGASIDTVPCRHKWRTLKTGACTYATSEIKCGGSWRLIYLHRVLTDAPSTAVVDHWDRNGMNNRLYNLRVCSQSQNAANKVMPRGFKGASFNANYGKWTAYIKCDANRHQFGTFDNFDSAIAAYDSKAIELFGAYARPNVGHEEPVAPEDIREDLDLDDWPDAVFSELELTGKDY